MEQLQLNTILWALCVAIAVILLVFCVYYIVNAEHPTITHKLLVAASTVYVLKTVTPLVYGLILWLPPQPRYIGVYLFLNAPHVMLFYLYEVRLYIFVSKQFSQSAVRGIRTFMYCLIGLFAANTLVLTSLAVIYATNTPSGGYSSDGPWFYVIKVTNYVIELVICFFILLGTFVSTHQRIIQNRTARFTGSNFLYMIILTSDTTIFAIVFTIVIYKSATSVDGNIGVLPFGNLGFQHLIDAIQYTLMVVNLVIPAAIYRSTVSGKSTSRSRNVVSSGKNGSGNGGIPLDDVFSNNDAKKQQRKGDDASIKTTTRLLRAPSFSVGHIDPNQNPEVSHGQSPPKQLQLYSYKQAKLDLLENGVGGVLGGYNNGSGATIATDALQHQAYLHMNLSPGPSPFIQHDRRAESAPNRPMYG
ncbi:hypothetical protein BJ742DRAFT_512281 [Cladochytrium replicatum]|nr:hypothetical protein BJ742DRAFT_512281 [Cladochytrium replicatum]